MYEYLYDSSTGRYRIIRKDFPDPYWVFHNDVTFREKGDAEDFCRVKNDRELG